MPSFSFGKLEDNFVEDSEGEEFKSRCCFTNLELLGRSSIQHEPTQTSKMIRNCEKGFILP